MYRNKALVIFAAIAPSVCIANGSLTLDQIAELKLQKILREYTRDANQSNQTASLISPAAAATAAAPAAVASPTNQGAVTTASDRRGSAATAEALPIVRGLHRSNGRRSVMIEESGVIHSLSQGEVTPMGWRVTAISDQGATLNRGKTVKALAFKEDGIFSGQGTRESSREARAISAPDSVPAPGMPPAAAPATTTQ